MDNKKLEILVTAIDIGSFSRAAETVGYTQSGLTHLMDALEREVGFPVIQRNYRGIALTEQGEQLMPAIREYIKAGAILENQISDIKKAGKKTLRIAAYASIAMHWMPDILYRFHRLCPDIEVDLRMVDHALEPFELLNQGKTDIIFAGRQEKMACEWIELYRDRLYLLLPGNSENGAVPPFSPDLLTGNDFLMPYGKFDIDVHAALDKYRLNLKIKPLYVDDETVIRMVGRGLGITVMSELMIRGRTQSVTRIPITPFAFREIGMGYNRSLGDSEWLNRLKQSVFACIECFQNEPESRSDNLT